MPRPLALRVYTASCILHHQLWLDLHRSCHEVHWTARWPAFVATDVCESPVLARHFWLDDECDVANCDVVLVYAAPGDTLRGALVEAGLGIAYSKRVMVIGDSQSYGTWQYHPLVERVPDLQEALVELGASLGTLRALWARWPALGPFRESGALASAARFSH